MSRATDCLMDAGCLQDFPPAHSALVRTKQKKLGFARTIKVWRERSRQRRELRRLANDNDLLKDVGLSRYDVQREGCKPFWKE